MIIAIHNDPVHSSKFGTGRPAKYPFGQLSVGQGFYWPVDASDRVQWQMRLAAAGSSYAKNHGGKFTTRYVEAKKAVGVWRVE